MSDSEMQSPERTNADDMGVTIRYEIWKALLKIAGGQIDPATAEVFWNWCEMDDPYGVHGADVINCVGRCWFARAPGSKVWIEFGDLPEGTREALWGRDYDERDKLPAIEDELEIPF